MTREASSDPAADFPEEFTISGDGETLQIDEVLTGRGAIFGKSGSGKSNTASVVVEELLKLGLPLLVVDTDGEYVGLTESFRVLHAGADDRCDVQVTPAQAEQLATAALDNNAAVILDVSGFLDGDDAATLIEAVLRELFTAEATRRKPFLVVVEEIHEFVPQQGGLDSLGELLIQITKRGRKRGLGVCGISQRPAAVDKDFITQCNWLVWHRLTWESDVDVVRRFLSAEKANAVGDLADGEAFVVTDWNEEVRRIQFRRKETSDAGATPSIDDVELRESAPIDVDEFGTTDREEDAGEETRNVEVREERGTRDTSTKSASTPPTGPENRTLLDEGAEFIAFVLKRLLDRVKRIR